MKKAQGIIETERLTLSVFISIVANFILGFLLVWPLFFQKPLSSTVTTTLIFVFFFAYYLLLLVYLAHYLRIFKSYAKGKEVKIIIVGATIGFVALAIVSFWQLGIVPTLSWLIPTLAVILLDVVLKHFNSGKK